MVVHMRLRWTTLSLPIRLLALLPQGRMLSGPGSRQFPSPSCALIVRGLYFDHQKKRIPDDYSFEVTRYDPWDFKNILLQVKQKLNLNGPRILGNVFGCAYALTEEDPYKTWWFIWFYNA